VPADGEVLAGATARHVADEFAAAVERFGAASTALVAAAGRLADERVWNGASAARFRAEQQALASSAGSMTQSLVRMAGAARHVLGAIDGDDAAGVAGLRLDPGSTDGKRGRDSADKGADEGADPLEHITGFAEQAHLPWDLFRLGAVHEHYVVEPAERDVKINEKLAEYTRELLDHREAYVAGSGARQEELGSRFFREVAPIQDAQLNGQASRQAVIDAALKWGDEAKQEAAHTAAVQAWLEGHRDDVAKVEDAGRLAEARVGVAKLFNHGVMGGLGVLSDLGTLRHPEDSGALGLVDRGAAAANAVAIVAGTDLAAPAVLTGANALGTALGGSAALGATDGSLVGMLASANALDEVPFVGEAILAVDVGTGLYLGINYFIHHPQFITDTGHAIGHAASWVGKEVAGCL
jgi:uncharacterized protein YukE